MRRFLVPQYGTPPAKQAGIATQNTKKHHLFCEVWLQPTRQNCFNTTTTLIIVSSSSDASRDNVTASITIQKEKISVDSCRSLVCIRYNLINLKPVVQPHHNVQNTCAEHMTYIIATSKCAANTQHNECVHCSRRQM